MRKKKTVRKRKAATGKRKFIRKSPAANNLQVSEDVVDEPTGFEPTDLGPDAAGQSGDIEGLSTIATGDSESVAQLVEEGQDLEAEKISGVENAPEPDQAEVRTHNRGR